MSKFSWIAEPSDIVVKQQLAIAVYAGGNGHVVVRQEGDAYRNDSCVLFEPRDALAIAQAIMRCAGELAEEFAPTSESRPELTAPSPAAQRARRYRRRKRDATVTPDRDGVTPDRNARDASTVTPEPEDAELPFDAAAE